MGVAVKKNSYWTIYKTVDLESVGLQINNNIRDFSNLKMKIIENRLWNDTVGIENQIEYLAKLTKDRFFHILPFHYRNKRALFNPLGSFVKAISGNLDEDDAIKYDSEIQRLQNKEHVVERKVSSMKKAFDKLVNDSEIINQNIKNLGLHTDEMEKIVEHELRFNKLFQVLNTMYQILSNFRTCYENIQEIETAIAFSKLNTLHQSIINSTELYNTLEVIAKHARTIYPVNKGNLIKLERNIILKSYINNNKLVFVLEVPLIDNETYNYYKVIPIPIFHSPNTFTIIPKYPYMMVNRLKYIPVVSPCVEIENDKVLCAETNVVQYPTETCIEQIMLLKNNYKSCIQNHIEIEKTKIQKVTNNQWLVYSEENLIITENCNAEILKYTVLGTYIVTPGQQCETQIGDVIVTGTTNATIFSLQLPLIQMPELQQHIQRTSKKVDLRNVDFSDVKEVLQSAKFSEIDDTTQIVTIEISIWTIFVYIIIIILIVIFITYKFQLISFCRNFPKPSATPSDNFSLREGGVKEPQSTHISFVSK